MSESHFGRGVLSLCLSLILAVHAHAHAHAIFISTTTVVFSVCVLGWPARDASIQSSQFIAISVQYKCTNNTNKLLFTWYVIYNIIFRRVSSNIAYIHTAILVIIECQFQIV